MPGFKTATKDGVQQTGFVFAKDASSQEVKKIATSADFQVGLSNLPKDLTVTGKATFTQGLSGSLTRLTDDTSYLVAGDNITITSASNGQVTITGTTRAPVDATYVVFSSNATLTSERIITAGSGITITDGGAGGSLTIAATGGGSGDVVGPASATDNAIARFNLTTGKLIQNSVTTVADTTGNITTLDAEVGSLSGFAGTYAMFGHATQTALGQYAIVQKNDGETWLNSVSDRYIRFTTDGNPSYDGYIGYSALGSSTQIALEGRTGSPTYVTIGRTTGAGSTTIRAGTGGITLTGEVSTSGDITIGGNDIKASDGNTNITLTSNTLTTFAGNIRINGNIIQASNGNTNITLTSNTLTTFAGDVRINGNDIQSSSGINAISMSGNNVTVAGDLTVSGGKITLTNGSTIDSETLNILKLTESDVRIIGSILSTDQTTFDLINTTATTLNIGGAATAVNVGASSALAIIGEAELGELPFTKVSFPGAYAFFSHKTLDNTVNGNYALVQSYDGYTYLNSPTTITFQYAGSSISGGTIGTLDNNTVSFTGLTGTATTTTLGNVAGASSTTIDAGTGGINIGTSNSARTINIGSDPAGTATTQQIINIGAKNTATSGFNAVNIADEDSHSGHVVNIISSNGTQTTGTSVIQIGTVAADCTVTIGSTTDYSITTLNGGTGGVNINSSHATLADATIGNATVGAHPDSAYTSFAIFGHSSYDYDAAPGSYALLAVGSTGTKNTWLNAPSGGQIRFANNDTSIGYMDDNEVSLTGKASTATTLTLGNTAGASSATIDAGTGAINIGTSNSARIINIGSNPAGTATTQQTVNIGAKNTAVGGFNVVNIADEDSHSGHVVNIVSSNGTQTTGTSVIQIGTVAADCTVTIGSNTDYSITTLNGGTGGVNINSTHATLADAIIGNATVGAHPDSAYTSFAMFGHSSYDYDAAPGSYALLAVGSTGTKNTWLNAPSGGQIRFANNDTTIGYMDDNEISLTGKASTVTTLTLGNTEGASSVTIDAGTGDINIGPSSAVRTINIGSTSTAANTIKILPGITSALGTVEIAQKSTFYNKVRICDDEAATGHEVYVNTGNNGAIASPITTPGNYSVTKIGTLNAESRVTLGSTNTASITTIQAGTNGIVLTTGAAGTGNISIGNSTETYSINIGIQADNTAGQQQTINVGHYSATGGAKNVNIRGDIIKLADTGGYVQFCGGYGSTGVTISAAGNIETNGTLTVDSTSILTGNVTFGGNIVADANENKSIFTTVTSNTITIGGASSTLAAAGSLTVGGGYGSAGVSISANGVIEADGNLTVDGTSINIGTTAVIRTVNIGTGAAVQTINLGTSANANIISLGSNAAQSIGINGGAALNLLTNAGTTTIDSGGLSSTGIINIGVFGYAQTISIGNTTVGTSVALRAGSGGITFETAATASSNLTVSGDLAVNGGDITTTSATFNLVNAATTINLGSTTVTRTINIGTNATNVQTINIGTGNAANAIAIGSNAASSVGINGGDALNLFVDAGTITMDSGGSGGTGAINVGTFGYAQTITFGNTTGATSLLLQAGTGNIALSGGNSTTYTIGTSSTTGTITVGQSTDTNTINIGNGATASTKTQTINVGNSTASGGITNINIGAASNGTNTITIGKFGTGLVNVILGGDDVQIGDNAGSDIGFFGTTPQPKTSVTDITNNITAGGTANTLTNYTSLTTYSTDAAAIRNNFYQIGVKLNAIIDALQSYGLI